MISCRSYISPYAGIRRGERGRKGGGCIEKVIPGCMHVGACVGKGKCSETITPVIRFHLKFYQIKSVFYE
jgi:hypothetical protein